MVICDRCKRQVLVKEAKYTARDENTMTIMCKECLAKKNPQAAGAKAGLKQSSSGKSNYYCGRCKYRFKYSPESGRSLVCPYCGRGDQVDKDSTGATAILKEVSNKYSEDR